jgi:hypothetical protein
MAYARTSLGEFRSMMKERLGGNGVFWAEQEINEALNEALCVWQLLTGDFVLSRNQTLPAGQAVVELDTTQIPSMHVVRMRRGSTTGSALFPISIFELDQGFYGRQSATSGTPEYWAPFGVDRVLIYPPASTTQTVNIQYYSADPRIGLSSSLYLDIGDEEIQALLNYAQWVLSFKEGLTEAFENVDPLKEIFLLAARLRNAKLRGTSLYKNYMGNDRDETKPTRDATEQGGLRK